MKKIILLIPLLLLVTTSNIFGQSYSPTTSQEYTELHTSRTINQSTRNSFVPVATDPAYSLQLIVGTASFPKFLSDQLDLQLITKMGSSILPETIRSLV